MKRARDPLKRVLQVAVCSALAMGLLGTPAVATAGSSAKLSVTATVLKYASLDMQAQPSTVAVTAVDIARGYLDVPVAGRLAIRNNSGGYLLEFASESAFVRQIRVRGLGAEVQMGPQGGVIAEASSGRGMTYSTHEIGVRFELSPQARQGVYPWPIRVSVTPL